MNDIYSDVVAAHGARIITPVNWYQVRAPLKLMMDRLEQVTSGWDRFGEVLDLRSCQRPDAASRAALRTRIGKMIRRLAHVGVIVEADAVMAVVARMVAFAIGLPAISLHRTEEEALHAVRSALP